MASKVLDLPQVVPIETDNNTRHLGGYLVEGGTRKTSKRIIRSGVLHDLPQSDIDVLTREFQLKQIVDLRTPYEIEEEPSLTEIDGVDYVNIDFDIDYEVLKALESPYFSEVPIPPKDDEIPDFQNKWLLLYFLWYEGTLQGVIEGMERLYIYAVSQDRSIANIRRMIDRLFEKEDGATMYHCTVGKDRTGVLCSIVLSMLGVDWATVQKDYLLTNEYRADYIAEQQEDAVREAEEKGIEDPDLATSIYYLLSAQELYLDDMLKTINELYGSMDQFITDKLGYTAEDIARLRAMYTEPV